MFPAIMPRPMTNPFNTPYHRGASQFVSAAAGKTRKMEDANEEEEEASLGGHIVSPQNTDRWCQALAKKISLLDMV
jgi:hypothetical protein